MNVAFAPGGYLPLVDTPGSDVPIPTDLVLGESMAGIPSLIRRRNRHVELINAPSLPRTMMLMKVIESNMDQPAKGLN